MFYDVHVAKIAQRSTVSWVMHLGHGIGTRTAKHVSSLKAHHSFPQLSCHCVNRALVKNVSLPAQIPIMHCQESDSLYSAVVTLFSTKCCHGVWLCWRADKDISCLRVILKHEGLTFDLRGSFLSPGRRSKHLISPPLDTQAGGSLLKWFIPVSPGRDSFLCSL